MVPSHMSDCSGSQRYLRCHIFLFSKRVEADAVFCQLLLNYRDSFLHMLLDHILYLGNTHEDFPRPPNTTPRSH